MTPEPVPETPPPATRESFLRRVHRWGVQNPKYYYIAPPSVWAVAIYILSVMRIPEQAALPSAFALPFGDKIGHMAAYALLAMLIIRGWHREKMPPLGLHGFVWLLCTVFGIMVEMQQGLSPYRTFEVWDMAANGIGAFTGQVIWQGMMWRWGRRTRLYPGLLRPDLKDHPSQRRRSTPTP